MDDDDIQYDEKTGEKLDPNTCFGIKVPRKFKNKMWVVQQV